MSHIYQTNRLGRIVKQQGVEFLHFSGTAYLGMVALPEFEELLVRGIGKHGPNHGSSRGSNIQLPIYRYFEEHFATGAGAPDALLLSSGFMAGQLAVQTLLKQADLTWVAPDTHPAVLPQGHLAPSGIDFKSWAYHCIERAESLIGQKILFISNAANPLKPEIHDFDWMKNLPKTNQYFLLIDDSHAFGVLGNSIYGTYEQWNHLPAKLMVCGSLGKALSLPAGIILGDPQLLDSARTTPIYRSSSPPSPAFLEAFVSGQSLYHAQKKLLKGHIEWINIQLENRDAFMVLDNYPVITFQNAEWVEILFRKKIIVSSFPYPGMDDPSVNRIILSAYHTKEDLVYLLDQLKKLNP